MLLIKLSAAEQRQIEKANDEPSLRAVKQLVLEKIQTMKLLKEFGKEPSLREDKSLPWSKAIAICREVIGREHVTMPTTPDGAWYIRLNSVLKRECMTEDSVRELAEYARDHLRKPVSFDFLICQQHRVRSGEFDVAPVKKDIVPEMPLLPED